MSTTLERLTDETPIFWTQIKARREVWSFLAATPFLQSRCSVYSGQTVIYRIVGRRNELVSTLEVNNADYLGGSSSLNPRKPRKKH